MTAQEIKDKLLRIISQQLDIPVDKIRVDQGFKDLHADSLDIVEFWMAIEEEFELQISDPEMNAEYTVGTICKLLCDKLLPKETIHLVPFSGLGNIANKNSTVYEFGGFMSEASKEKLRIISIDAGVCGGVHDPEHVCKCKEKCQACKDRERVEEYRQDPSLVFGGQLVAKPSGGYLVLKRGASDIYNVPETESGLMGGLDETYRIVTGDERIQHKWPQDVIVLYQTGSRPWSKSTSDVRWRQRGVKTIEFAVPKDYVFK